MDSFLIFTDLEIKYFQVQPMDDPGRARLIDKVL